MSDNPNVVVLREVVDALTRTHGPLSHDYIKDEKRCQRCRLIVRAKAAIAALEAQGEAVAWTMRNAHGERIAMTDDDRAKQPEWVLRKWANAAPLYLHPSIEAQASAPGGAVADDARRWAFYVHAMTDESGIAREAIRRQAFPAHTKEAWDACIDKAMAEVVLPEAANEAALAARTGKEEAHGP